MKKFGLFLLVVFVSLFAAVATASAQKINPERSQPKGYRELIGGERKVYEDLIKNGGLRAHRSAQAQEAEGGITTPPTAIIAIREMGDSDKGIYTDARSTGLIKSGSIVIGVRINATGAEEFLFAYQFSEDVEPGGFWANLENGKRAAYSESGGKLRHEVWILRGGQTVYASEIDFQNPSDSERAVTTITDGYSYYDEGRLRIMMIGDFSGSVGIVLKEVNGWGEYIVPREAIELGNGYVLIKASMFPDYEPRKGTYVVTIADGVTRISDSYTLRINTPPPFGKTAPGAGRPSGPRKR